MTDLKAYIPLMAEIHSAEGPVGASALVDSKTLNMSQATIGRQLLKLEQAGIVCKVSNKGRTLTPHGIELLNAYQESTSKADLVQELVNISFSQNITTLLEVMEIRMLLEPYAAFSAAQNASAADIENLENIAFVHRYRASKNQLLPFEDLEFHLAIAKTAKNKTLTKLIELLLTENNAYIEFAKASTLETHQQFINHFQLLDAIKAHDAALAQQYMKEHLQTVFNSLMQQEKQ